MNRLNPKIFRQTLTAAFSLLILLFSNDPLLSADYTLTVTTTGAGTGSVNSNPSGISCQSGVSSSCSFLFNDVDPVTLTASPAWTSLFTGWGGACSGSGDCVLTLTADTEVTADFSPNYQAKMLGMSTIEYATVTDCYANAKDNGAIVSHVYTFIEDLTLNRPISIIFYGGMEGTEYLSHLDSYFTTLQGVFEVQQGSVEINSLIIQ